MKKCGLNQSSCEGSLGKDENSMLTKSLHSALSIMSLDQSQVFGCLWFGGLFLSPLFCVIPTMLVIFSHAYRCNFHNHGEIVPKK